MTSLLDVNVLVSLFDANHDHHTASLAWFNQNQDPWASCPITQNGYLRIVTSTRYRNSISIEQATPSHPPPGNLTEFLAFTHPEKIHREVKRDPVLISSRFPAESPSKKDQLRRESTDLNQSRDKIHPNNRLRISFFQHNVRHE